MMFLFVIKKYIILIVIIKNKRENISEIINTTQYDTFLSDNRLLKNIRKCKKTEQLYKKEIL